MMSRRPSSRCVLLTCSSAVEFSPASSMEMAKRVCVCVCVELALSSCKSSMCKTSSWTSCIHCTTIPIPRCWSAWKPSCRTAARPIRSKIECHLPDVSITFHFWFLSLSVHFFWRHFSPDFCDSLSLSLHIVPPVFTPFPLSLYPYSTVAVEQADRGNIQGDGGHYGTTLGNTS